MNKFDVGDKVIIKSTIGSTNEVVEIVAIGKFNLFGETCMFYLTSNKLEYMSSLIQHRYHKKRYLRWLYERFKIRSW